MTEYAIYKSRGESWVELYRCGNHADAENYFHSKLGGKEFVGGECKSSEVSFVMADGTTYTFSKEVEGWS